MSVQRMDLPFPLHWANSTADALPHPNLEERCKEQVAPSCTLLLTCETT